MVFVYGGVSGKDFAEFRPESDGRRQCVRAFLGAGMCVLIYEFEVGGTKL